MLGQLLQQEIQEAIRTRDFETLRVALVDLPVPDVAEILIDIPDVDEAVIFRLLPRDLASKVFAYLPPAHQEVLLQHLSREAVAEIVNSMTPDDRTRLLEELPGEVSQRLLAMLSPEELRIARQLLGYPEESIARLMTPEYVAIREEWSVGETLQHIRKVGRDKETLNVLYVVDERGRLLGDIRLGTLVLSEPAAKIGELMDDQFAVLSAWDDREKAVEMFRKYDRVALPVVESGGILIGIVTIDDVLDVAEAEASEDIQMFGGQGALDDPYFETSNRKMIWKRVTWLMVLFAGEMFTGTAMRGHEKTLATWPFLILFVPLIISTGGNSGSQSASLVVRGLAVGEMTPRQWARVVFRESYVGIILGLMLGCVGFVRARMWNHTTLEALTVSLTMVVVVTLGTLVGSLLPFLFKRLGFDPAVSSSPFIASLVDVVGLILYFTLANMLLPLPA